LKTASLEYFNGDTMASDVWISKYALQDKEGNYKELTPTDTHKRLAKEFARIEKNYPNPISEEEIFSYFDHFKYIIPQGSPMEGIGNNYRLQSLSNCFVIDSPADSYGGILKTDQEQAQLMKRRGGVGFDISNIRPKGMQTNNAAKTTDGIGIFMERFSNTTREVAQNGRRGALMLSISINCPEIETFIIIKNDRTKVTGANLSIRINDEFMNCVKNNLNYTQKWPEENPTIFKEINAKKLWSLIISNAWENAEPGVLFWDTALRNTPSDIYKNLGFKSVSTNPCSEIVLSAYDACRLLIVNVLSYVINPFTKNAYFDFKKFGNHVIIAQRLMDDLVDLELEQIEKILKKIKKDPENEETKRIETQLWHKIKSSTINGRRTGLGPTAIGDTVAALNIKYGSDESIKIIEQIYKTIAINAARSSVIMAKERGAFPIYNYELEKDHEFLNRILKFDSQLYEDYKKYGRRNIADTTSAPTGTTSLMTQTSSGIEPVFMLEYKRRKKIQNEQVKPDFIDQNGDKWQEYTVYHHEIKHWMDITGETDITKSPYFGATANEIDYIKTVEIQAVAQKWVAHSISKTANLKENVTKETVSDLYMKAWELGCKGFTVYREGSRSGVLISNKKKEDDLETHNAPKRPKELLADYYVATANGIKFAVIIGLWKDTNKPYEIFAFENPPMDKNTKGKIIKIKKGHYKFINGEFEIDNIKLTADRIEQRAHTIFLSMLLRHGTPLQKICDVSKKVDENITSFSSVCRRVLSKYIEEETVSEKCPECKIGNLIREEGCMHCNQCSYSRCS
ncbi:MAG: adenosylcobalamin-dependent ribonucleoside-diphosphate reductase, partial [Clostridia bacterium]